MDKQHERPNMYTSGVMFLFKPCIGLHVWFSMHVSKYEWMYILYYLNLYWDHVSTASEFLPANICDKCLLNVIWGRLIKPYQMYGEVCASGVMDNMRL